MRSKAAWSLCVLLAVVAGVVWRQQVTSAQVTESEPYGGGEQPREQNTPYGYGEGYGSYPRATTPHTAAGVRVLLEFAMQQATEKIRQAAAMLRDAKGDEEKAEAQDKLSKLLEEYFNEDLRHRYEELAKIEERTRKLREQLEHRRAKKEEIIELQMKVFSHQAEGLGFFNDPLSPNVAGTKYQIWTPTLDVPVFEQPVPGARSRTPGKPQPEGSLQRNWDVDDEPEKPRENRSVPTSPR